ncbi:MAG: tetratricopeptide repeat protein [Candidatus Rariloculaceae bacterium]
MAHKKPQPYLTRSLQHFPLLCLLALVFPGASALAQEEAASGNAEPAVEPADAAQESSDLETAAGLEAAFDDEVDEEVLEAAERAMETVARLEAELSMKDLFAEERYAEAIAYADRVVELIEEESGESLQLGVALSNLAMLQRRVQLYDVSEQNFVRSVEIIRESEGTYTDAVINPLIGLGVNYQARGDYLDALTIFEEARTVSRRVNGLMNEQQLDIIDHLSNTMVSMQRYEEADEFKLSALNMQERIHGTETMEILPAIYKYGRWLRSSYRYHEERLQYTRAMDIIRDIAGSEDIALVTALRETGNSFRLQKYPEGRGVSALRRALEIAQTQPVPDPEIIAEILIDIGDWNTSFSKVGPTGEEYLQAWALLGEVENGDEIRRRRFDDPRYVLRENPSNRGLSDAGNPDALPGHVLITFDVDPAGRTRNVTIAEAVPPGLKDDSTARAINRSRFRPRIEDGEIVWARGMARNFTFHFVPQE